MTDRERFKVICRGEKPDYWPIFALPGAPGMSGPFIEELRVKLIEQGMPEWVGKDESVYELQGYHTTQQYWGTTSPVYPSFGLEVPGPGIQCTRYEENGWEIFEYETGARVRQVLNNDAIYIMPEYQVYDVRDRKSWEFYRQRTAPVGLRPAKEIEADIAAFDCSDRPSAVTVGYTWGVLRNLMGPEKASTILYDDPGLAHEIMEAFLDDFRKYSIPLIERIRPDILHTAEDICYNHGMLIGPQHFDEFCGPFYRLLGEVAHDCAVDMVMIDTDGNINEFTSVVEKYGVNAITPCEPRAGTDLFALRSHHHKFIFLGWLEKEVVNEGNEHLIESEIRSKVSPMLEKGYYFPNLEHTAQPLATFNNLCRFMTLLHDVTGNPEGEFPRV